MSKKIQLLCLGCSFGNVRGYPAKLSSVWSGLHQGPIPRACFYHKCFWYVANIYFISWLDKELNWYFVVNHSNNVLLLNKNYDRYLGFYPRPVLAFACVCVWERAFVSVCVSVNHKIIRAIFHQPFKLELPNVDMRCKRPWLKSCLFWGAIDFDLQGQI